MYMHIEAFLCEQFGIKDNVPLLLMKNSTATKRWSANGMEDNEDRDNLLKKKSQ